MTRLFSLALVVATVAGMQSAAADPHDDYIAAIKDSVMVASFHVQGSMENPTVTPAPLSTLSEFFFGALRIPQSLITIPGTDGK